MATKQPNKADEPNAVNPAFDKLELTNSAALFGTTPEIMAGALVTVEKEKITRQEAKDAVAAFLERPVGKERK